MTVLAIIPGPLLVIFGAVFWLAVQGDHVIALALSLWGETVVGLIDTILRPALVGRDTALSDPLAPRPRAAGQGRTFLDDEIANELDLLREEYDKREAARHADQKRDEEGQAPQ